MATSTASGSLIDITSRYFATDEVPSLASSNLDAIELSQILYPTTTYTDNEKVELGQWITTAARLSAGDEDSAKHAERLGSLNIHLSTRTTLLGSKPSIADVALYSHLAPSIKAWSLEERTGEQGYHHIVRHIDFVQNSPLFGLSLKEDEKIAIDPNRVIFIHKPLDPKEEKERKKKEKEKAAGVAGNNSLNPTTAGIDSKPLVVGKSKERDAGGNGATDKVKDALSTAQDTLKDAIAGSTKKEKKEKQPKPPKAAPIATPLSPSLIDLRVGHILEAIRHPNADSLYVSTIAVGDPPGTENTSLYTDGVTVVRTVCSGLAGLIPLEEMQNRKIVAVCNLKPVTMRGVKSAAMVLAASPRLAEGEVDNHTGPVELVEPPKEAPAGARVVFAGWEDAQPEGVLNPKKKIWEQCQVGFTTTDDLGVGFEKNKVEALKGDSSTVRPDCGKLVVSGGGACVVRSLKGAIVR